MYIPYTISKILASIPKGKEIDWKRIWRMQDIYPSLAHQIEIVAQQTMLFLRKESNFGNERTLAGKEGTWEKYRKQELVLTNDFFADLVDSTFEKEEARSQERKTKFNLATDMWAKYMMLGADYLERIHHDMETQRLLSASDQECIRISAMSIRKGTLNDRQVKRLNQIFLRLDQETDYIIPEK